MLRTFTARVYRAVSSGELSCCVMQWVYGC